MSSTESPPLNWRGLMGHAIPGSCYVLASSFLLLWIFMGSRELILNQEPRSRPTFYQKYLQSTNVKILFRLSLFMTTAAGFGICYEGIYYNGFVEAPIHPTLYSLYFFPGICGLLESTHYLPQRSSYVAAVLVLLGQALLFLDHVKHTSDAKAHEVLAYLAIACAVCLGLVVQFPERVDFLIGGYLGAFLQGSWLSMIGIKQLLNSPFQEGMVVIDLIFHFLFVGFAVAFSSAYLKYLDYKTHGDQVGECRSCYETVAKQDLDGDEDRLLV